MIDTDSRDVSLMIRDKLTADKLPLDAPERIWVGNGTGLTCSACDQPVTDAEREYEFDSPTHGTVRFHQRCLDLWHQERAQRSV